MRKGFMEALSRLIKIPGRKSSVPSGEAAVPHKSIHIGINDYPSTGADLKGCLNDASSWETYFGSVGFKDRQLLTNSAATADKIIESIAWVMDGLKPGSISVITFAGHGCQIPDGEGEEPDGLDEALCAYDFSWDKGHVLSDDVLFSLTGRAPRGSCVVMIADCCHSGTLERQFLSNPHPRTARFMPPPDWLSERVARSNLMHKGAARLMGRSQSNDDGTLVMLSGCAPDQVSYDTWRDGRSCGAFSAAAVKVLTEAGDSPMSYSTLISRTQKIIGEPQDPQFGGPRWVAETRLWSLPGGKK